ncbi:MAG: hypothetical protein ABI587_03105 [Gemmatimonadales bacterium]
MYFRHSVGNRRLTPLSNMLTDLNLTDRDGVAAVIHILRFNLFPPRQPPSEARLMNAQQSIEG